MLKPEFEDVVRQISQVILGKEEQIRLALTCLFAKGHLLIEDIPGIGKTTLAKVLAKCLGLTFQRMQFTSDMLPGDILGVSIFIPKTSSFEFHPGPIFTHILLADEINRATPKTQSALLEAMEERQVTIEGKTRRLNNPFFVIATQNPLEHSGTFPLPESQLDRFLMRIEIGYPGRSAEKKILQGNGREQKMSNVDNCLQGDDVLNIQSRINEVHASDALLEYLQDILQFTRTSDRFHVGLSPRAGLALLQAGKSFAFLHGRDHVLPEDIQRVLPWVVRHRLKSRETLGEFTMERITEILREVPVP